MPLAGLCQGGKTFPLYGPCKVRDFSIKPIPKPSFVTSDMEIIDPIEFPAWDTLLLRNGNNEFFHTSAWARVLRESYGFRPIYFIQQIQDEIDLLMPFVEINSPWTGKRGVSLPFSDQCRAFARQKELIPAAVERVTDHARIAGWKYAEWRDSLFPREIAVEHNSFFVHEIDLTKSEAAIYSSLKDSNRRCIRRALKEGVSIRICHSLDSVQSFYRLNCITRKRHGLPPQPYVFFRNVFEFLIDNGYGAVVIAVHSGRVVAAAMFFFFGSSALYKYGASDLRFQGLRPNNLLFWEAIRWLKASGRSTLNLGRTELDNPGLLQYKRLWGAAEVLINYHRYDVKRKSFIQGRPKKTSVLNTVLRNLPTGLLRLVGRAVYKHSG